MRASAASLGMVLVLASHGALAADHANFQLKQIVIEANSQAEPAPGSRAGLYPAAARKAGLEGNAVLRCEIKPEGRFGDCKVVEEDPAEAGFGPVALAIAPHVVQLIPKARGGVVSEGAAILPFRFVLTDHEHRALGETDLVWEETPRMREMTNYPLAAAQSGQGGSAVIECALQADGRLHDCRALTEVPYGWGFKETAVRVASKFKARQTLKDGSPLPVGAIVRIPVMFVAWPWGPPPRPPKH